MHEKQTRVCRTCGAEKAATEFYFRKETGKHKTECKECCIARHRLKRTGWSAEAYENAYIRQDGKCGICRTHLNSSRYTKLAADHCHKTKKIRGLLCTQCNTAIGLMKDSTERLLAAVEYLKRHTSDEEIV
jgi:hypothetical protein